MKNVFSLVRDNIEKINILHPNPYHSLTEGHTRTVRNKLDNEHIQNKKAFSNGVVKLSKWPFSTLNNQEEKHYNEAINISQKNK